MLEPTMTEAEVRKLMGVPEHIELQWTQWGWAMRTPVEAEMLPITIGYIQPGCYPSDAR